MVEQHVIISPKIYKKEILSKERDGAGKKEREKLENKWMRWGNLFVLKGKLMYYRRPRTDPLLIDG